MIYFQLEIYTAVVSILVLMQDTTMLIFINKVIHWFHFKRWSNSSRLIPSRFLIFIWPFVRDFFYKIKCNFSPIFIFFYLSSCLPMKLIVVFYFLLSLFRLLACLFKTASKQACAFYKWAFKLLQSRQPMLNLSNKSRCMTFHDVPLQTIPQVFFSNSHRW
jgi:hypothetical protein